MSAHNNEYGLYITHIYAYDAAGHYVSVDAGVVNHGFWKLYFNAAGGACSTDSIDVRYNAAYTAYGSFPTPTRDGYRFDGWYTSATGGTKINGSETFTGNSDMTLDR